MPYVSRIDRAALPSALMEVMCGVNNGKQLESLAMTTYCRRSAELVACRMNHTGMAVRMTAKATHRSVFSVKSTEGG